MNRDALSLVKEYASIKAKVKPLTERLGEIEASLMLLLPNGKTESVIGDVTVSDNVEYPFGKSTLTKGQKDRLMKKVPDTKKWAALYPADHAATRTVRDNPLKVNVSIHKIKG